MELGKIGCFNIRSVLNNQYTWQNMAKFTFSDGICLLCAFMCDKRRRHFKHHWTFETKSDLISLGIWSKGTTHPFRNQSTSIHDAIFYCILHVHTPSCPNMPKYGLSGCQPKILFSSVPWLFFCWMGMFICACVKLMSVFSV